MREPARRLHGRTELLAADGRYAGRLDIDAGASRLRQRSSTPERAEDGAWWNSFGDAELSSLVERRSRRQPRRPPGGAAHRGGARPAPASRRPAPGRSSTPDGLLHEHPHQRAHRDHLLAGRAWRRRPKARAPGGVSGALPGLANPFDPVPVRPERLVGDRPVRPGATHRRSGRRQYGRGGGGRPRGARVADGRGRGGLHRPARRPRPARR